MRPRSDESGFALILAILALMLLTFLGLTLAQTTSTELQIATNYRNAQQALYNAEAGMDVGRRLLRERAKTGGTAGWALPAARLAGDYTLPVWSLNRTGASGEASRNFENSGCDADGQGFGAIADTGTSAYPYQNVFQFQGQQIQGTFTIWVRRGTLYNAGGQAYDDTRNDRGIMAVEGTAPFQVAGTNFTQRGRAVRVLETPFLITGPCLGPDGQELDKPGCAPVG